MTSLVLARPAAAQDTVTQFWPEVDTFVRLSARTRIFVPLSATKTSDGLDESGTVGAFFDYFADPIASLSLSSVPDAARSRRLFIRAGYSYTAPGDGDPATNALDFEATGRLRLPWEFLASLRHRFDLNFTAGGFDPRYRGRIRLDRVVPIGEVSIGSYVLGEVFYSFNKGAWIKTRVAAGLELHAWSRVVPEIYFQRDHFMGSTGDVRGFGLKVSLYLR